MTNEEYQDVDDVDHEKTRYRAALITIRDGRQTANEARALATHALQDGHTVMATPMPGADEKPGPLCPSCDRIPVAFNDGGVPTAWRDPIASERESRRAAPSSCAEPDLLTGLRAEVARLRAALLLAGMVAQDHLDIAEFVAKAERADAFAPLVDPTLWTKGHTRLDAIKALASSALAFQAAARKFQKTMAEIEAKEKR